ncbi:hypothetical protein J7F03_34790 [Streptomyces sp. ISL-43]|uniref:hypothetical protein n=1 Tax=Streptomyces sp. ISL-43 TaxID=2819183 RepID=UPI001BED2C8E|nr:hypothetical protein [Streptomyces sp. ISL-43]MBT2452136.1 hypothetical protein [Streptomyces sp. ISL-43]
MNTQDEGSDLLDVYLHEARERLGPADFEAVVRATDATCVLLAGGHPAILSGPDGGGFGPELQREYLGLLAVLITGRTDHHVVPLTAPDGTPGWAVVEGHLLHDPHALQDLCTGIVARAKSSARTAAALERMWSAG